MECSAYPRVSTQNVFVVAEKVDERAFLFRGKRGTNAHRFTLDAPRVYEDLLGALHWLEGPSRLLGVACFLGDLLPKVCKFSGGYDHYGVIAALDFTLVGALKGGADGDDPDWARHL